MISYFLILERFMGERFNFSVFFSFFFLSEWFKIICWKTFWVSAIKFRVIEVSSEIKFYYEFNSCL